MKVTTSFSLLSTGKLGGDVPLISAIPKINAKGTILLGTDYLILFVELETQGIIFACADETSTNDVPNSKQIYEGNNVFNKPCAAANSTKVKYDFNYALEPARIKLSNLKSGTTYDIYYVSALDVPNDIKLSPAVMKLSATTDVLLTDESTADSSTITTS